MRRAKVLRRRRRRRRSLREVGVVLRGGESLRTMLLLMVIVRPWRRGSVVLARRALLVGRFAEPLSQQLVEPCVAGSEGNHTRCSLLTLTIQSGYRR